MTSSGGVLTLASHDDVVAAARLAGWFHRPEFADVQVSINGIPPNDSVKVARTIRSLFNDCACAWGGATFLLVLAGGWFLPILPEAALWMRVGGTFLIAATASLAAKALGLAWSRWRLLNTLKRLRAAALVASDLGAREG